MNSTGLRWVTLGFILFAGILFGEPEETYRAQPGYRFTRALSKLDGIISSGKDVDDLLTKLAKDGRGWTFSIEGLARIYEDAYPGELERIYAQSKRFEDNIGRYGDALAHLKYVDELKWETPDGKAPKGVIDSLNVDKAKAREKFLAMLIKDRWIEVDSKGKLKPGHSPRVELMQKELDGIAWHGPNQDRQDVLAGFRRQVKKKFIKAEYDFSELQSGVHELRRQLRWPMIWFQEIHGMFAGTAAKIEGLEGIKRDKSITQSPFAKLPTVSAKYPILVPKTAIFWMRKLVGDLGDVKDLGEAREEWLLHAVKQSKYTEPGTTKQAEIVERLLKTHPKYIDSDKVLAKVQNIVEESSLFPTLLEKLEKQQGWSKDKCTRKFEKLG